MNIPCDPKALLRLRTPVLLLAMALALSACGKKSEPKTAPTTATLNTPTISMALPDSLTGGTTSTATAAYSAVGAAQGVQKCQFKGDPEPFRNGFTLTRFMVGAIASWGCLADQVMILTTTAVTNGWVTTDGVYKTLPPDPNDPKAPTGVSVLQSGTITEVNLFWGANNTTAPGMYFAWDRAADGSYSGKVLVDAAAKDGSVMAGQPDFMRMDYSSSSTQQLGEMFIHFNNNPEVDAFRIKATKKLDGTYPTYTAQGNYPAKKHFDTNYAGSHAAEPFPALKVYAIADVDGHGAAVARVADWGWSITPLDDGDHLGSFRFTKDDTVFFTNLGQGNYTPVFIHKNVSAATYLGDRAINTTGNVVSAAAIDTYFGSGSGQPGIPVPGYTATYATPYQTCTGAANYSGPECAFFLNTLFDLPGWSVEVNLPRNNSGDARKPVIDAALAPGSTGYFFGTSCPADAASCAWSKAAGGVFEMVFP
ncbi:MAG: hypothetical protein OEW39_11225 [Deltaproteobacteria bacterium]|nr:hypothetical protein [Deltaproteobacteria bacterium]